MKRSIFLFRRLKPTSFTLVELLVVMGIIAILAGVLFTAGGAAIKAAKRAKAMNMATQIQTAALNYYTEYSVYPLPTGTDSTKDYVIADNDATSWQNLIIALCGNFNPFTPTVNPATSTVPNTRSIAFLSLKTSDLYSSTAVAPKNPMGVSDTVNPYFAIAMDADYNGVLGVTPASLPNFANPTGSWQTTGGTSTAGVAVWANCNGSTTSTNSNFWVHTY